MAEYFVDSLNGLDTNNGSFSAPFKSLEYALNIISNGDTINLFSNNPHTIPVNLTNLYNKSFTLQGYDKLAEINCSAKSITYPSGVYLKNFNKIKFTNFVLINTASGSKTINYDMCQFIGNGTTSGVWNNGADYISFTKCLIDNCYKTVYGSNSIRLSHTDNINCIIRNSLGIGYIDLPKITNCILYNVTNILSFTTDSTYITSEQLQVVQDDTIYGFDFAFDNINLLIKQNNQYYSIKNRAITLLGTPINDAQKEQWFNDYGVGDLKLALLTPDENGNKLIDSLDDKFEVRMMKWKD